MPQLSAHEALIYAMVTMSAVDSTMTDRELERIGRLVSSLPVFQGFDPDSLTEVSSRCATAVSKENGMVETLEAISDAIPPKLRETAYALAVEIAAADLAVKQEELRYLSLLRDHLKLDKLTVAAIERGARARHQTL